jgi:adenine-specific DNA glycosylase
VEELPNLGKRATTTARHFVALAAEHDGHFLVRQRPAGVVNAHLWEFPNVELVKGDDTSDAIKQFGIAPASIRPLCVVKHSITRYRITLTALTASLDKKAKMIEGAWKTPGQMHALAFTSAHKKILRALFVP